MNFELSLLGQWESDDGLVKCQLDFCCDENGAGITAWEWHPGGETENASIGLSREQVETLLHGLQTALEWMGGN